VPKTATPAPTQELGANQWLSSLGEPILEELESDAALIWPSSNDTYAAMLNDAHVEGMYRGVSTAAGSHICASWPRGRRGRSTRSAPPATGRWPTSRCRR
jgi:hypothetical protein